MIQQELTARFVQPEEGNSYRVISEIITFIATSEDTDGAYSLFKTRTPPGAGVPPHYQIHEVETFLVLEGTYEFQVAEERIVLGPGGYCMVPRETVHRFQNAGDREAQMLIMTMPGGYHERFFAEAGDPVSDPANPEPPSGPPDFDRVLSAASRNGIEILPPPE